MLAHQPLRPVPGRKDSALSEPEAESSQRICQCCSSGVDITEAQGRLAESQGDALAVFIGRITKELVKRLIRVVQARPMTGRHGRTLIGELEKWTSSAW